MNWANVSRELLTVSTTRLHVIVVGLVALVVLGGVVYSLYLGETLRFADEGDYYSLANNLAHEHEFTSDGQNPTAFRPPGYPLILSPFVFLGADVVLLRIINFVALGSCIYLIWMLLSSQSRALAGFIGASLTVMYPVLFYAAGTLYPQTIGAGLFLLTLYLLISKDTVSLRRGLFVGFLVALLVLMIPIFIVTCVLLILWFAFSRAHGYRTAITISAVVVLVLGAWSVRNYVQLGSFVFVSTNSGYNLLLGNSEETTANTGVNTDISQYVLAASAMSEVERDEFYRAEAIDYALSHKIGTLKLYGLKVLNYFNFRNELATESEGSPLSNLVMLIGYGTFLLLLVLRLLSLRRSPLSGFELLLITLYISNALVSAIFFTRIRLRLPFDFLLIALAAMYLGDRLEELLRSKPLERRLAVARSGARTQNLRLG